jgi:hypothetical protein
MGDMVKGFFLLLLLLVGGTVAYASWLTLLPVSEADAEIRISHACILGQLAGRTLNGPSHRPISCDCVEAGLRDQAGVPAMAKGAEAMRQLVVAQIYASVSGEKAPIDPSSIMADRDVLTFIVVAQKLDRTCKVDAFAAR